MINVFSMEAQPLPPRYFDLAREITAAEVAKRYAPDRVRGNMMVCPFHDDRLPSLRLYQNGGFFCYGCHATGGSVDLAAELLELEPLDAAKRICGDFRLIGPDGVSSSSPGRRPERKRRPAQPARRIKADFSRYLTACAKALPGSPGQSYLEGRGFTPDEMRRFLFGWDGRHGRVTVPFNRHGSYYTARAVDDFADVKYRDPTNPPGAKYEIPLFNERALYQGDLCFVVEAPLDAALITAKTGFPAVALPGRNGARLLELLKERPTAARLLLTLDNDGPGQTAQEELADELLRIGARVTLSSWIMWRDAKRQAVKDPGDILTRYGEPYFYKCIELAAASAVLSPSRNFDD